MSDLIDVYERRLQAAKRSPDTISTRCRVLRHAHNWMPNGLDAATDYDIISYLARPLNGWPQTTVYSHLRGYYSAMVKAGRRTLDPTDHVDRPAPGNRTPDPVETWQLQAAVDRSPAQPWRTATILASYAGLRCCELCRLERGDVTQEWVHVRCGKGGQGRYVPTHPILWDHVQGLPSGPLVRTKTGLPCRPTHLSSKQHAHWSSVDLATVHMHRFRHWFGTTLADNDVGIEVICDFMGHKSIEQTRRYIRISGARKRAAMMALPSLAEHQPGSSRLVSAAV